MKFVILGRENCTYCTMVKTLMDSAGITYEYRDISDSLDLKWFLVTSGLTTVPQVFVDGILIGGYQETVSALAEGNS